MRTLQIAIWAAALVATGALQAQQRGTLAFGGAVLNQDGVLAGEMAQMSQPQALGTARSMALGGAFTSLGADLASMSINPAGLGMYRRNEIALTPMMTEEDFDAVLDTNLKGAFNMIRHTYGVFIRKKEGCIINISSVSGLMGNAGQANYAAAKAGLIGLTKTVAKELAPKGVRCNAIAPGFVATDMTEKQGENKLLACIPLGRMGQPEEIAQAAAYLATASYVTGEVLRVDGGLAM